MSTLAGEIVARCLELGFAAAGVAPAHRSDRETAFRDWISRGEHATMTWLAETLEQRLDPARLLPGARSAVMVADLYAPRGHVDPALPPGHARVARYARGRDYHRVVTRRLHTLADELRSRFPAALTRVFADSAPVAERELAQRAGLGWVGKHTLLIHPHLGSWFVLGGLLTTLDLGPPAPTLPDRCGSCTRCIDACPTAAITPYHVDASRCIAYLTIERRQPIDPSFHRALADRLIGCDICQEVCPHNSPRPGPLHPPNPQYAPRLASLSTAEVRCWSADDRAHLLAGTPMMRATLDMLRRNAEIVERNLAPAHDPQPEP